VIDHFMTLVDSPRDSGDDEVLTADVARTCQQAALITREHMESLIPDGWPLLGEVLALSRQLAADLSEAANEIGLLIAPDVSTSRGKSVAS
jgi:hypothetical protein